MPAKRFITDDIIPLCSGCAGSCKQHLPAQVVTCNHFASKEVTPPKTRSRITTLSSNQ